MISTGPITFEEMDRELSPRNFANYSEVFYRLPYLLLT